MIPRKFPIMNLIIKYLPSIRNAYFIKLIFNGTNFPKRKLLLNFSFSESPQLQIGLLLLVWESLPCMESSPDRLLSRLRPPVDSDKLH